MADNYNNSNIVLAIFPGWCGGNFLLRCLEISDNFYQPQTEHVEQQRFHRPARLTERTKQDKFDTLLREFDLLKGIWHDGKYIPGTWNDFRMAPGAIFKHESDESDWHPMAYDILNSNIHLCIAAHGENLSLSWLKKFPNAKVIYFINFKEFKNWRLNINESVDWQHVKSCFEGYNVCTFNTNSYFDQEEFLLELEKIYNFVGADDFDRERMAQLHTGYMEILTKFKNDNFYNAGYK